MKQAKVSEPDVWGIGCSVPGTVQNGAFWYDKVQEGDEWQKFQLAPELENLTGLRVLVENDATVAAIGESLYGAGRAVPASSTCISISASAGGWCSTGSPIAAPSAAPARSGI